MDVLPIGSVTLFTNISKKQFWNSELNEELQEKVSAALADWVQQELNKLFPDLSVVVVGYSSSYGCIITTIIIGAAVAAASSGVSTGTAITAAGAAGAVYAFIKDYDDLKSGFKHLMHDLSRLWVKITRRKKKPENAADIPVNDVELNIEVLKQAPEEFEKFIGTSFNDVIVKDGAKKTLHPTCLMYENLLSELNMKIKEEEVIKSFR